MKRSVLLALLVLVLCVAPPGIWWFSEWRLEHSQDEAIAAAAARYEFDPALVKAVVWKESRFHPAVRGKAGEIGLMQLMDAASQEWAEAERVYPLGERALFNPATNVLAGTWYLRKLVRRYRNTDNPIPFALADYNAGRGNVLRWAKGTAVTNSLDFIGAIGFPSTSNYVVSVQKRRSRYVDDFASKPGPTAGARTAGSPPRP